MKKFLLADLLHTRNVAGVTAVTLNLAFAFMDGQMASIALDARLDICLHVKLESRVLGDPRRSAVAASAGADGSARGLALEVAEEADLLIHRNVAGLQRGAVA